MKHFKETPVDSRMLHPRLKYLVDLVLDQSEGLTDDEIYNVRSECEYRFGLLQGRNESFGNIVLVVYIDEGYLVTLKVDGDDFNEDRIDLSVIPNGMEALYIVTYLQNMVMESDPFIDYDLCQVLCNSAHPTSLVDLEEYSDDEVM